MCRAIVGLVLAVLGGSATAPGPPRAVRFDSGAVVRLTWPGAVPSALRCLRRSDRKPIRSATVSIRAPGVAWGRSARPASRVRRDSSGSRSGNAGGSGIGRCSGRALECWSVGSRWAWPSHWARGG